jgi:exodeoxyribonuclease V gamma subunit
MKVLTAPQLTPLLAHFVESIRNAPLPPRENEIVVVQSQGMRRWLTLQLADALGCAASLVMPFPAHFIREVGLQHTAARTWRHGAQPYSRDALMWRIDAKLAALTTNSAPVFAPLRTYLATADARSRFGLAMQIAGRFDDYQLYRADILDAWEAGANTPDTPHARWQAALWREIRDDIARDMGNSVPHLAAQIQHTINAIHHGELTQLPTRISVFGVSSLPPKFIELLAALSAHVPVTVYTASLHTNTTHPLATLYARQSQTFLDLLTANGATIESLHTGAAPAAGTLLHQLQQELAMGDSGESPLTCTTSDATLRIHDAHGDVRQLEIIRDQILAALANDATLRPHDVLLLVPDATQWAPVVDAVFGVTATDNAHIPYRIADRPHRRADPAADAFARLLALEGGRLARSEVLALLATPLVRQAAGLTDSDVQLLDTLTLHANVRWGYNSDSRVALGLPAYDAASWRLGLDRLLMGMAVGRAECDVLGVFAEAGDTAGEPEVIAKCAEWVDTVAAILTLWATPRTLTEWRTTLGDAVNTLLAANTTSETQHIAALLRTLDDLTTVAGVAAYDAVVPFAVVRDWIDSQLESDGFGAGFLYGGMTVAALKPMRSLPFRVIAVAGLDDGVFPRRERRTAFDLLDHEQRPGDRDVRSDDRQLFLDLVMAAQDRLILAYTGRDVRDGSPRAPSVVVDELLDHCDRRTTGSARGSLVVSHPLQPFSGAYFAPQRDPRLFTYSSAQASAARSQQLQRATPQGSALPAAPENATQSDVHNHAPCTSPSDAPSPDTPPSDAPSPGTPPSDAPFVVGPLAHAPSHNTTPNENTVTLGELTNCWANPSKYFCQDVLAIALGLDTENVADDEPFDFSAMHAGGVRMQLLSAALSEDAGDRTNAINGARPQTTIKRLTANGSMPFGALGDAWSQVLSDDVARVVALVPNEPLSAARIAVNGATWKLHGQLGGIGDKARYVVRAGRFGAEHRIRAWIEHVVMCAAASQTQPTSPQRVLPTRTVLLGKMPSGDAVGEVMTLEPVDNAVQVLSRLVAVLPHAQLQPLPFFAQAGCAWYEAMLPPKPRSRAKDPQAEAIKAYHLERNDFGGMGGDHEDPYVALCFRGKDPMHNQWVEFEVLAHTLWSGLLQGGQPI